MITYNPKWNRRMARKDLALRSAKGVVLQRLFIDEDGFNRAQTFLEKQKHLWEESDQFVGVSLEIVVI